MILLIMLNQYYSITKRIADLSISFSFIILFSPFLCILGVLIFLQDFKSPFYISDRVGINGVLFKMHKFRSMKYIHNLNHIVTTTDNDPRITKLGKFIRAFKIDELSQLLNVFLGTMSLVGPRPNVKVETDLYTTQEKKILTIKPGITDFASIVFFDLNNILRNSKDPNTDYNQLIRPWKSRLALIYVEKRSLYVDFKIIFYTVLSFFSKRIALSFIQKDLKKFGAPKNLIDICSVNKKLFPYPPPGSDTVVPTQIRI